MVVVVAVVEWWVWWIGTKSLNRGPRYADAVLALMGSVKERPPGSGRFFSWETALQVHPRGEAIHAG
jgi:hypothetical protein